MAEENNNHNDIPLKTDQPLEDTRQQNTEISSPSRSRSTESLLERGWDIISRENTEVTSNKHALEQQPDAAAAAAATVNTQTTLPQSADKSEKTVVQPEEKTCSKLEDRNKERIQPEEDKNSHDKQTSTTKVSPTLQNQKFEAQPVSETVPSSQESDYDTNICNFLKQKLCSVTPSIGCLNIRESFSLGRGLSGSCWNMKGLSVLQLIVVVGAIFVIGFYFWNNEVSVQKPVVALRSFADTQEKRHGLKQGLAEVMTLPVEQMNMFAGAACVHGDFQKVQVAMEKQLKGVPQEIREEILDSALIEGVSVQNSRQDSTLQVKTNGKANAYLLFFSTQHIQSALTEPQYSSCVMVAGMEFSVAEELASWETQTDYKITGYEDCNCGMFSCKKCPIIKPITTKRPIFKRHQLTLLEHELLHKEMQRLAVEKAKDLTGGTSAGPWWSFVPMVSDEKFDDEGKNVKDWDFRGDPFTA